MTNIEKYRHADSPKVADISWEVLAARGIETGDVMGVWRVVGGIALIAEELIGECAAISLEYISEGDFEAATYCQARYALLVGWAQRDVQELTKFLVRRNFHFPEGDE
jgi:hypothetical protein